MRVFRVVYSVFFPLVFLVFLPGLLWKLWRRPGWKSTFGERFGCFGKRREELEPYRGCVWIHAVSVGETVLALALLRAWRGRNPECKFVLSTTTTTGQALAREKAPEGVAVIFTPLDFGGAVRRTLKLLRPAMLVIFETEIWPNLILLTKRSGARLALVNARMSDHSVKGYRRGRRIFGPLLENFDFIGAQSDADAERFRSVSPGAAVAAVGNLKFDQSLPEKLAAVDYRGYFGAGGDILLAASTHPGEEELVASAFLAVRREFPDLKLVLVPRHAERGGEVAQQLERLGVSFVRRSQARDGAPAPVDAVIADTTGEMLALMAGADWIVMGKSLAGHDEGHNLLEPALLGKPIFTGGVLKNFRFILRVLSEADAVIVVDDAALPERLAEALRHRERDLAYGERARAALAPHRGATDKLLTRLEELIS